MTRLKKRLRFFVRRLLLFLAMGLGGMRQETQDVGSPSQKREIAVAAGYDTWEALQASTNTMARAVALP